jgi:hypothetical protein
LKEKTNQENDKKKTTIKIMSIIFDIKTKQNQMEIDENEKTNLKKSKTKKEQ